MAFYFGLSLIPPPLFYFFFPFTFYFPFCVPCSVFHLLHLLKSVTDVDCTLASLCGCVVMHSALSSHFTVKYKGSSDCTWWTSATICLKFDVLPQVITLTKTMFHLQPGHVMWSGELE